MSTKSKNNGCGKAIQRILGNLSKNKGALATIVLAKQLKNGSMPALGLTEPTICARGTRRLHEINSKSTQFAGTTPSFTAEQLVGNRADFAVCQAEANPGHPQFELPLLWQYDLFHVVEQLPENRSRANEDEHHSFFHRGEAERILLEHHDYISQRGGNFKLLWHCINPFYEDQDFYSITGQTTKGNKVIWNGINPFGQFPAEQKSLLQQAAEIEAGIDRLIKSSSGRPSNRPEVYLPAKLDRIAAFAAKLNGKAALFRPYHEQTPGAYWWWAARNLHPDLRKGQALYRKLWENTRTYLENKGVDNLLYVYAPDVAEDFTTIDTKTKFLAHYKSSMPDIDKIDVLSMTAYLMKLLTPGDRRDIQALTEAETSVRQDGQRKIYAKAFGRMLTLCGWLREEFPDKVVGISETGLPYHEIIGAQNNKIFNVYWQQEAVKLLNEHPPEKRPHFITFWRSDAQDRFFPYPGKPDPFSKEVAAIITALRTQVADFPVPVA